MPPPALELADIFRTHGPAFRAARPLPRAPLRAMRAIETCRTAALGGRVEQCGQCPYRRVVYNSCRNRHCPKCQSLARARWLQSRTAELLPVEYFHVVFTLPEPAAALAFQNPQTVYPILFRAASEAILTLGRDPRHLGAELGLFAILHTWGQNLLYHPHLHCVVAGGGPSPDGDRWIGCRPGFFLSVRVLSRLFRRLFIEALAHAFQRRQLRFTGPLAPLEDPHAFQRWLASLRQTEWVVYAKPPFGGPQQVLEYLGRYTHRTAISNQRLMRLHDGRVTFQWKDYRRGHRNKLMTLDAAEFIRRFLLHVLPPGFQRIRYYGLLANCHRKQALALCQRLLACPIAELLPAPADYKQLHESLTGASLTRCPRCHTGLIQTVETLAPSRWPSPSLDSS